MSHFVRQKKTYCITRQTTRLKCVTENSSVRQCFRMLRALLIDIADLPVNEFCSYVLIGHV